MVENQTEKILEMLNNSSLTSYYISKKTGITAQTIINYRNKTSIPTAANAKLLEYFFRDENAVKNSKNSENVISENSGVVNFGDNAAIDGRNFYSDSPDVLRAQVDVMEERIREKDAQIKEKDAQIRELLEIIKQLGRRE